MKLQKNQQGFTIIEVVLVLAIAGLIFLMIFIALPALQRGQRDTARRNDVSTVASAINTYKSNNQNRLTGLTGGASGTLAGYVDSLNQYDKANITVQTYAGGTTYTPAMDRTDDIHVFLSAKCDGNTLTGVGANSRTAAALTSLENNGSTPVAYCQDV